MTTATAVQPRQQAILASALRLVGALRPQEGWLAALLLTGTLTTVIATVERADWVDTPSLQLVLLLGLLTGLLVTRPRVSPVPLLLLGLLVGALTVVWQISVVLDDGSGFLKMGTLAERLRLWVRAAGSGDISLDTVPFAFGLVTLTWLLGYLAAWALFRYHSFWLAVLPAGAGIITNLAYLPDNHGIYFALYLFAALLLLARVSHQRRVAAFVRQGGKVPEGFAWPALWDGLLFASAVLVIAYVVPVGHGRPSLQRTYELLRSPIENFRSDFNRLFAGLPARKPFPYRSFDSTLPFQGTINLSTSPALQVRSPYPMYWKARSYSVYTSKGWVTGDTRTVSAGWRPAYQEEPEELKARYETSYAVTLNLSTGLLFAGGQPIPADGDFLVETYDSPVYRIDFKNWLGTNSLPSDVREVAQRLFQDRAQLPPAAFAQRIAALHGMLPDGLVQVSEEFSGAEVVAVILARRLPNPPDVLAIHAPSYLRPGDTYTLKASVSYATPDELRAAGEDYPAWVRDRYLQLPSSTLPTRVVELARRITANAPTPYDKARAIVAYLSALPYTTEVEPPPFNGDGVDHFLFTLKRGYSDYYASAMAVMLRASGVPARLAAGYLPGQHDRDDVYVVRYSDSHAWVEVYFPSYGWVPFEPTPGRHIPVLGPPEAEGSPPTTLTGGEEQGFFEEESPFLGGLPGQGPQSAGVPVGVLATGLGIPLAVALALYLLWLRFLRTPATVDGIYQRMSTLAVLGGVGPRPSQTPYQYGRALAEANPTVQTPVLDLVDAYVRWRYGRRVPTDAEMAGLRQSWRTLQRRLLWRILSRR